MKNLLRRRETLLPFDFLLLGCPILLMAIGILFIYSSSVTSYGVLLSREYIKQVVWAVTGTLIMVTIGLSRYSRWKGLAPFLYVMVVLALVITLFAGKVVNGARAWIGIGSLGIQPSEFAKITTILMLSSYLADRHPRVVTSVRTAFVAFILVALPMGLVLLQPDLGTAIVFIPIFFVVSYLAGVSGKILGFLLLVGGGAAFLTGYPLWATKISREYHPLINLFLGHYYAIIVLAILVTILLLSSVGSIFFKKRYYHWLLYFSSALFFGVAGSFVLRAVLKEYQLMRLIVFLDPYVDPKGAGWNIIQSITAVGSGGGYGKGFLMGTQSHYRYLPKQSTDFIFSVISEEMGFLGGGIVFLLLGVIVVRAFSIILRASTRFDALIVSGIVGMFFFHAVENIGMAIGVMPVAGIPLIFLSYGGSSIWTGAIGMGLMLNVSRRCHRTRRLLGQD